MALDTPPHPTPSLRPFPPQCPASLMPVLDALDADASLVQRHLWLISLLDWVRGKDDSANTAAIRVDIFLDVLESQSALAERVRAWWLQVIGEVDGSTLLADFGFASHNAFVGEFIQRLQHKVLPASPETTDAAELFALVMPSSLDAQWIAALSPEALERLAKLLTAPALGHHGRMNPTLTYWQCTLLDALTYCVSQVRAAGFSPGIRLRMSSPQSESSPFHTLAQTFDTLREAWLSQEGLDEAVLALKTQLEACRAAAATVYTHLDAHGISVDLVFRLRQLRERVLRIRLLLDCLLGDPNYTHSARLMSALAAVGQERRSLRALLNSSSSLLAAKVAERSSETGEHYITRTRGEYREMLGNAAGGGALTAVTTALKFGVMALGLSAFWYGFWSGVVYAASFVLIQLLHYTLATKQPAMTAPAMAAKLKDISEPASIDAFVDEVSHLVRSQVAAVLGNVAVVFPVAIALSMVLLLVTGHPMIDAERAHYVLHSLDLWGPSVLFAAFTGVLLFASSIIAGWVENWFVLHRLDSALRYNPSITHWLGAERADRWAHFMRHHISGFASNISLGFMLGLVPPILAFLGLVLDARHVTLSSGQLGAACAALGWDVVHEPALWWAVACIPVIGALNLGVSFYLAFRVALQAHNVSDLGRLRIRRAVWQRLRQAPLSFVWPTHEATTGVSRG